MDAKPIIIKRPWYRKKMNIVTVKTNEIVVFRVIPHSIVANNNKRLWRSIHKMYEMYESKGSRRERNGFRFTFREKDYFWFDVIFRQIKGKRKIEFYVSTTDFQAVKLKRKIENKMDVTLTEVPITDLEIPVENTIVQELRYLRHDIFSLNTNAENNQTPITSILNTVDDMQFDGDMARLSIVNEVESRKKWVKNSQWAREKLSKGKVPQRASLSANNAVPLIKMSIAGVINEVNGILVDTFQAFSNVFMKSDKSFNREKVLEKGYTLQDEINSRRLSSASNDKSNQPVFKSHIRVAAHSSDKLTRETFGETLALSMNDMAEDNELHGYKARGKRRIQLIDEMNTLKLSTKTKYDVNVNLVSTDEMSKLAMQIPSKDLQRRYADELDVKKYTEVTIPQVMRDENGIRLGVAELKDEKIDVFMPVSDPDNFYRGYTFIGGQGAGKDTAIKNWVVEGNIKHGIGFVVIDAIVEEGERGMADGIRDALPPENIIDLNMNDENYIPPMDLTEVVTALGRNGASRFADEMIDFMQIDGLNRSEKYLTDAAKASNGSLFNIKRIIEDEDFRFDRIEELLKQGNKRLANDLIQWGKNEDLGNKCDAILVRLNRFFGNERLYDIFAQDPLKDVDFRKWMAAGKVIIIRIPNGRGLGKNAVKTLAHWITLKTFMTRLLMSKAEQENGCFIVFNEPEQYESDGLTELMGRIGTEGRKERLGSIYAFHHWNKLSTSLQENLQGGGVQQFLFMNDHTKTFDLSKHRFEDTIPLEEAYKTPTHHAIISVRAGGEMQPAFICHMSPPVSGKYNNSFLTKRHAQMYGRSWSELQDAL